jgi:large subunit ribosomal protein L32
MAVPKQRKTKSRRNQRRMHIHLDRPSLVICPHCKEKKLMHTVCKACGYYKNREIIDVLKGEKKDKEKETSKKKPLNMESLSKKEK